MNWVPIKSIPLFSMTKKSQVWFNFVSTWLASMLKVIKKMNFPTCSLSGDHLGHLRHEPGFVDFALMVNLHLDLNAIFFLFAHNLRLSERRITSMII